jgi:hypothetical protein
MRSFAVSTVATIAAAMLIAAEALLALAARTSLLEPLEELLR